MKKILNALKGNGCQARMLTAAMTVLSAMAGLTSCANEDTALDNTTAQTAEGRTVQFTATLAPKGDDGGQTRAITVNDQNTANETLNVAWAEGEQVAVYYEKTNGEHATATAKVTAVDNTGAATIETLSSTPLDDPQTGSEVTFIYPYSLAKDGEIDKSKLQNSQQGLLTGDNSISTNFDAATGKGTITVSGSEASVSGTVTMTNRVCICKMTLGFIDTFATISGPSGGKTLTIGVGDGSVYTISSPFEDEMQPAGGPTAYRAFKSGDVIYVAMLPVDSKPVTFTSISGDNKIYSSISSSVKLTAGSFYRNIPLTLIQGAYKTLTTATGELTLQNGDIVTGTGGGNTQLKIAAGATVILKDVTNIGITKAENIAGIECLDDATIILEGTNSVAGRENAPGIFIPQGSTLTIQGSGSLTATGGSTSQTFGSGLIGGAGIGGTKNISCGNIVIEGGTITATGTGPSAGIGSGDADQAANTCGDISISGSAKVTATGGANAAGIGSGHAGEAANTCGDISISGSAQVTATGGTYAAGIGSGNGNNYFDVYANFTLYVSSCGDISITGGTIEATGGDDAAGIGSGSYGKFTSISITSGITSVTATSGGQYYAPIGKGESDEGSGNVTIDDVTIDGGINYSPIKHTPSATTNLNWTLSGNTWTLTPKN